MSAIRIHKGALWALFIVFALVTEFYFVPAFGGSLRLYHLLAPALVLLLMGQVKRLLYAPLFYGLAGVIIINVVAALAADNYEAALLSVGLLAANATLGVSVAMLMLARKVSPRQVIGALLFVVVVSVIWTAVQLAAWRVSGINLGLSEYQVQQIQWGFGPGFRTEANTFAKFLNVAFLLTFPTIFKEKGRLGLLIIMGLFSVGLVLGFTRSVFYTLPITLFLAYLWYLQTGRGRPLSAKPFIVVVAFALVFMLYAATSASFNSYATHKIANFFNPEEIVRGGSAGIRLMLQSLMIESIFHSPKNFFLGSGWGQIFYFQRETARTLQAGGADLVVFTAYGGVFSGLFYLTSVVMALRSASQMSRIADTQEEQLFFQGVLFATLGMFITGMINGSIIAPEYWIVFGLAIYSSYRLRAHNRAVRWNRSYARINSAQVPLTPSA